MDQPRILAIVGSQRNESNNRQLAQIAKTVVGDRALFELLDYSDVPLMNQDIEYPAPASVQRARAAVKSANGVWIFTPEYNHSYPGGLKNLIDWLSRPHQQGRKAGSVTQANRHQRHLHRHGRHGDCAGFTRHAAEHAKRECHEFSAAGHSKRVAADGRNRQAEAHDQPAVSGKAGRRVSPFPE